MTFEPIRTPPAECNRRESGTAASQAAATEAGGEGAADDAAGGGSETRPRSQAGNFPPADPFEPWGGVQGSGNCIMRRRSLEVSAEDRAKLELARKASELGKALRQPGETLAEAVRREAQDIGEDRRIARKLSATVHDPIDLRKVSASHPKARKYEPLPPDLWNALRGLAEERGEQPMAVLPMVVELGIEALRKAA